MNPLISQTTDSDDIRVKEIKNLILQSKYSIHDLSRIEPLKPTDLPRFNMPFELGLDIGCKSFSKKSDKKCLILEEKPYRYKEVLSDISGQDIKSHNCETIKVVKSIRDWFRTIFTRKNIPSYKVIWDAYNEFHYDFEMEMKAESLDPNNILEIPFSELITIMKRWIKNYK